LHLPSPNFLRPRRSRYKLFIYNNLKKAACCILQPKHLSLFAFPDRLSDVQTLDLSIFRRSKLVPEVPIFARVLVHRYFFALNRFCIPSPIVPWTLPGYTLSSLRRTALTGSERRTTQRFSMRLPLTVRWTTGAAVGETSTESRDVSSRGVYFFLSKDVREGSPVEILLTLPNEITLAGPVRVRCLGRVQRTEPREEGAVGVVAAIERYEFLRGDEEK
jgi:hypothetical protein